jgi:OOP family OmpA-OmpF porin
MDFYARGGAAFWEYDGKYIDEDGSDPYYGLGAAFNVGSSLDLYLEWVRFDLETNIDTIGLGVRYTF